MVHVVHFYALILNFAGFLYMQKITTETVSNHISDKINPLYVFFQRQGRLISNIKLKLSQKKLVVNNSVIRWSAYFSYASLRGRPTLFKEYIKMEKRQV